MTFVSLSFFAIRSRCSTNTIARSFCLSTGCACEALRGEVAPVVKRGGLLTSSSACSGFAGPRAQVGLAFFAKITRGVHEVPFWRG